MKKTMFALLALFSLSVFAKTENVQKQFPQFMSFQELKKLSPARRVAYLAEVREIITSFEKDQAYVMTAKKSQKNAFLGLIQNIEMISRAEARENTQEEIDSINNYSMESYAQTQTVAQRGCRPGMRFWWGSQDSACQGTVARLVAPSSTVQITSNVRGRTGSVSVRCVRTEGVRTEGVRNNTTTAIYNLVQEGTGSCANRRYSRSVCTYAPPRGGSNFRWESRAHSDSDPLDECNASIMTPLRVAKFGL